MVLEANPDHWNVERGPRLSRVIYRNDVGPAAALDLVCDADGEVDILGEVAPPDAARVRDSEHADLVATDAMRVVVAMVNRGADGVPLHDVRTRVALNLAVDRDRLVREAFAGYASPLSGFTPRFAGGVPDGLAPYPHDPERAARLLDEAGWPRERPLVVAAPPELAGLGQVVVDQLAESLPITVELVVPPAEDVPALTRRLVEKRLPLPWHLHLHAWLDLSADAPPAMIHREFVHTTGAFRTGPPVPDFDALFEAFATEIDPQRFEQLAKDMDQLCYDQALALFLCSPQALYAVNKHVRFVAHRATFELAETEVDEGHWSRR